MQSVVSHYTELPQLQTKPSLGKYGMHELSTTENHHLNNGQVEQNLFYHLTRLKRIKPVMMQALAF
jgi:hypothetical protein